ncbi:phosphonate metabolism transcriptional regulator PhnF [Mesobacterium sp. TK19101]|uniref:Phosphonate metabolism transcriptional regulator PhnF n=1 Tax=Mesobacterium hydrothermale TaxID=3111907 RepID=A0ABU6HJE4_9RHOB|nr:phosphonate metabolism transcriptional regulator PhnF [Mesobacterium sp. TK19101]MEC3862574.1 phosphonate metabolism transcriptional regulator PhnF [Mesobacterium sp. TK19101]
MGNKTPLWAAIARELKEDLAEGRYAPGDKLPTEAALADRFGVNRHTVRHALAGLVADGVVRTRRGSGAFVAARPTDYPIGRRVRFTENLRRAGRLPGREGLGLEVRAATGGEATVLHIATGDRVLVSHGLSTADGQPLGLSESLYPLDRLPGLQDALAKGQGVTQALQSAGVADYTRASTRITAVVASATQAVRLQVQEGAPLLKTTALNVDPDGVPVEYGRTWWAGDRLTLTLED